MSAERTSAATVTRRFVMLGILSLLGKSRIMRRIGSRFEVYRIDGEPRRAARRAGIAEAAIDTPANIADTASSVMGL
jgi:hypothetical protein